MLLLDTSVLIDCLTGPRRLLPELRRKLVAGERMALASLVLYEWLRGPRTREELASQEALFPAASALPFGPEEAALSASLFRSLRRPRERAIDIAIAACALRHEAALWTLNPADFADIPGLQVLGA